MAGVSMHTSISSRTIFTPRTVGTLQSTYLKSIVQQSLEAVMHLESMTFRQVKFEEIRDVDCKAKVDLEAFAINEDASRAGVLVYRLLRMEEMVAGRKGPYTLA